MSSQDYLDQLISTVNQQFHATTARSDVLKALGWMAGVLLAGDLISFASGAPQWFSILLSAIFSLAAGLYLFAFAFCLFRDRDALRSEKYTLHKMAIERGLIGDDMAGVIDRDAMRDTLKSASDTTKQLPSQK